MAGISIEYYVRLEQGRETNPSPPVLRALSQALLLDREARIHLYALANQMAERAPCPRPSAPQVREGVLRILEAVRPYPAYVLNRAQDVLAANPEALALLAGLEDWPPERRNTVRYSFTHPAAPRLFADWESVTASHVAHLRAQHATEPRRSGPFRARRRADRGQPALRRAVGALRRRQLPRHPQDAPPPRGRHRHGHVGGALPRRRGPAPHGLPGAPGHPRPRRAGPAVGGHVDPVAVSACRFASRSRSARSG